MYHTCSFMDDIKQNKNKYICSTQISYIGLTSNMWVHRGIGIYVSLNNKINRFKSIIPKNEYKTYL